MRRKFTALALVALFVLPALGVAVGASVLTIAPVEASYESGEEVELSGSAAPGSNVTVVVVVNDTLETIYNETILADEDGNYSCGFVLSVNGSTGLYNVTASADGETAKSSFTVTEVEAEPVLMTAEEENPEPEPEASEEDGEEAVGHLCAIDRALRFVEKMESAAARLQENGYMATQEEGQQIASTLGDYREQLADLRARIEAGTIANPEAAHELARLKGAIGRTMGQLHSTANRANHDRAERFMEQMEKRIQNMEGWIQRLGDKIQRGKATNALQAAGMKLERIRARLAEGEMEDAIDDIEDMVEELDTQLSDMDGPQVTNLFKTMNKLKARIQSLENTAKRLGKEGVDTTDIEEKLRQANELLDQVISQLQEGNTEEAEELIQQVKDLLEQVQEIVEETHETIQAAQSTEAQLQEGTEDEEDENESEPEPEPEPEPEQEPEPEPEPEPEGGAAE